MKKRELAEKHPKLAGSRKGRTGSPKTRRDDECPIEDRSFLLWAQRMAGNAAVVQLLRSGSEATLSAGATRAAATRGFTPERQEGRQLLVRVMPRPSSRGERAEEVAQRSAPTAPPTERVGTSLWAKDPTTGKNLPPSLADISQGALADCYLFAAMAAIVNSDPQRIVNMIKDNGNGTFTVTFKGIGFFSSATQTVTADFEVSKHGNVKDRGAFWPIIIEKAYAQEKGGLDKIEYGYPGAAVDDMTDAGPSKFDPRDKSAEYILSKLVEAKTKKWPVTIFTPKQNDASAEKKALALDTPGLRFGHAYAVTDVDVDQKQVKLFNPWGRLHPNDTGWISVELVRKFFVEVNIND